MYKEKNEKFFMKILNEAFQKSESAIPHVMNFEGISFVNDSYKEMRLCDVTNLMNDTINKANEAYIANHTEPGKHIDGVDCIAGTAAYTALTMNTIWARDAVLGKIDEYLKDSQNEKELKANGISPKDFEPLKKELKDYTLEALKSNERTKPIGEFIESLENKMPEEMKNNRLELLDTMGLYVQSLNNDLEKLSSSLKKGTKPWKDFVKDAFRSADLQITSKAFSNEILNYARDLGIGHENGTFTDISELGKKPVAEDLVKDIGVMLDSQNITILYGDEVHPTDFLEHYKSGNLSEAESKWAGERVNELKNMLAETFSYENPEKDQTIDLSCFYANGKQIVTKEELEKAKTPSGEYDPKALDKMNEKLMASMLSGDNITVKSPDNSMQTTVRPMVEPPKKAEFKFGQILKWIYEYFFTNKNKEKAKVDAMNDKFEKNEVAAKASRIKTSLVELSGNGVYYTLRTPTTKPPRERTTGLNGPQR